MSAMRSSHLFNINAIKMTDYEEHKDAHRYAKRNLAEVKEREKNIIRRTEPIYSESGKLTGHRLVKVGVREPDQAMSTPPLECAAAPEPDPAPVDQSFTNQPPPETMTTQPTKRCSRCGEDKPTSDFYASSKASDGLSYWCKACTKESAKISKSGRRASPPPEPRPGAVEPPLPTTQPARDIAPARAWTVDDSDELPRAMEMYRLFMRLRPMVARADHSRLLAELYDNYQVHNNLKHPTI